MRRLVGALVLGSALLATRIAPAGEDAQVRAANALFFEGHDLLEKKDYKNALDRFLRSQKLHETGGTSYNIAVCYENLGKLASAWTAYRDSAARAGGKDADKKRELALKDAARLEPRLSHLTIDVEPTPGLALKHNGAIVEAAVFGVALPVDSGAQSFSATAPDRRPWSTTLELAEGSKATVRVPILEPVTSSAPMTAPSPAPAAATMSPPPARESTPTTRSSLAVPLEIGGGVLVVGGLVLGAISLSKWNAVTAECPDAHCPSELVRARRAEDVDSASTFATVATVGIAVGAIVLAAGVVMHLGGVGGKAQSSKQ